jgi:hypothetical protein
MSSCSDEAAASCCDGLHAARRDTQASSRLQGTTQSIVGVAACDGDAASGRIGNAWSSPCGGRGGELARTPPHSPSGMSRRDAIETL